VTHCAIWKWSFSKQGSVAAVKEKREELNTWLNGETYWLGVDPGGSNAFGLPLSNLRATIGPLS